MKIPKEIKGYNKIRDAAICLLWDRETKNAGEIAERFNLTQRRIEQILITNKAFIPIDKAWEKKKRIHAIKTAIKDAPPTKKDKLDLIEQLRKEIEGDKPQIEQHIHLTNFRGFIEDAYSNPKNRIGIELRESSSDTE